jgi:hypothetical protein
MTAGVRFTEMKTGDEMQTRRGYVMMLLASLAIPLVHFLVMQPALERTRYPWGLMPGHFLMLKWFGQLAAWGPVVLGLLLVLSWRKEAVRSPAFLCRVAVAFYVLAAFYGAFCALVLCTTI